MVDGDADGGNATSSEEEISPGEYEDNDVRIERARVNRMCGIGGGVGSVDEPCDLNASAPVVIVQNLRKEFQHPRGCSTAAGSAGCCCFATTSSDGIIEYPSKIAVRSLSLAIDAGEVLGLLGHNGAGKTTTMRIMTGETAATRGHVHIGGHSIRTDRNRAFRRLGYCPQHDALWKNCTVREHLELYAAIRGVRRKDVNRVCAAFLSGLHIGEHAHKQTQHCSGGTRRKLSYAMAMVGAPKVVLLDEPSTGMDPASKRFLWDTILASFQGGRGAILTTHSMEEADALCSRVGIMVKGELRCLGSTQHLKNIYGAGYTLEVKLRHIEIVHPPVVTVVTTTATVSAAATEAPTTTTTTTATANADHNNGTVPSVLQAASLGISAEQEERSTALRMFVADLFPDALLEESFADRLVYSVPQTAVSSLAQCFAKLEQGNNNKSTFSSVTETKKKYLAAKTELEIEEYSFSQTTLEQVFLKFAHYDDETSST